MTDYTVNSNKLDCVEISVTVLGGTGKKGIKALLNPETEQLKEPKEELCGYRPSKVGVGVEQGGESEERTEGG